jgi:NAD(P)H-dependent FMN reductase
LIAGSPSAPSRSTALLEAVGERLAKRGGRIDRSPRSPCRRRPNFVVPDPGPPLYTEPPRPAPPPILSFRAKTGAYAQSCLHKCRRVLCAARQRRARPRIVDSGG